jgi:hypothetical protein
MEITKIDYIVEGKKNLFKKVNVKSANLSNIIKHMYSGVEFSLFAINSKEEEFDFIKKLEYNHFPFIKITSAYKFYSTNSEKYTKHNRCTTYLVGFINLSDKINSILDSNVTRKMRYDTNCIANIRHSTGNVINSYSPEIYFDIKSEHNTYDETFCTYEDFNNDILSDMIDKFILVNYVKNTVKLPLNFDKDFYDGKIKINSSHMMYGNIPATSYYGNYGDMYFI